MSTRDEHARLHGPRAAAPRQRRRRDRAHARFVFVRDGFHFWAFLLAPLWMLRHRMWLEFIAYAADRRRHHASRCAGSASPAVAGCWVGAADRAAGRHRGVEPAALEALAARLRAASASWSATIWRTAERRFFDGWVARDERPARRCRRRLRLRRRSRRPPRPTSSGCSRSRRRGRDGRDRRLRLGQSALGREGLRARGARVRRRSADPGDQRSGQGARADRVVLPGVGAFADCRRGLDAVPGMVEALNETVRQKGRPFLGICVGMQLMAERGREYQVVDGLRLDPRRGRPHRAGRSGA